jgi:hypothetical protein
VLRTEPNLDITVIYADDRAPSPHVRRAPTVRAIAPSRLAGCATLLASAIWLFVVWFPLDSYLDMCLIRRTTFPVPAGFDLGAFLFGRTPVPADLANPAPPSRPEEVESSGERLTDEAISAYRSPAAAVPPETPSPESSPNRQGLPIAVYSWVVLMTAAGLALAAVGGTGLTDWLTGSGFAHRIRVLAIAMLLFVGIIAYAHWPGGGDVPRISAIIQFLLGASFVLLPWAACATSTPPQAVRILLAGMVVLAIGAWVLWGRYGTGAPEIAQRTGVLFAMALASLLGAVLSRRARNLSGVALALVLMAIVGTLAGMGYVQSIGGFVEFTPTAGTYAKAAGLQALALMPLLWSRLATR